MSFKLKRYAKNPILKPILQNPWEAIITFNTAAINLDNRVHLIYRARGCRGGISRFGYASTKDGYTIDERLDKPIFTVSPDTDIDCHGVEDPRIAQIGDRLYMTYSAYGYVPGMYSQMSWVQIAITSISVKDFLKKNWNWSERIYPFPYTDNKDAALFPEKIKGKYVLMHRIPQHIWIGYSDDLKHWEDNNIIMYPQGWDWEYYKIGGGGTPIKTEKGWIIIYHAVDNKMVYRLGLAVLDLEDPKKVIYRHPEPILEPEEEFELQGDVSNVTFTCGAVEKDGQLFVYYGAADTVICVATADVKDILKLF
ncbi:MAG: glycosidase [Spirochaetes bacterium]|nr:glycosidase [Spirochaetota bacterium]